MYALLIPPALLLVALGALAGWTRTAGHVVRVGTCAVVTLGVVGIGARHWAFEGGPFWLALVGLVAIVAQALAVPFLVGFTVAVARREPASGWRAVAPALVQVAVPVAVVLEVSQNLLPSGHADRAVIETFHRHEAAFGQLVRMAHEDQELVRLMSDTNRFGGDMGEDWRAPRGRLPEARWNEYRALFGATGVRGLSREGDRLCLVFWSANTPGGAEKGYVYSETPVAPLRDSVDPLPPGDGGSAFFRPLGDRWYLYYRWLG